MPALSRLFLFCTSAGLPVAGRILPPEGRQFALRLYTYSQDYPYRSASGSRPASGSSPCDYSHTSEELSTFDASQEGKVNAPLPCTKYQVPNHNFIFGDVFSWDFVLDHATK
ncbi:MAG: hypothetical protein AAF433_18960 [Bacteroidota bacterium]